MPLEVGDIVRVNYKGTSMGQRILYGMDFVVDATASVDTVIQDLDHIAAFFADDLAGTHLDTYLQMMGTNYTLDEVRTQKLNPARSAYVSIPKAEPGVFAAPATSANLQLPITFRTAFAGRRQVSVKKIGPVPLGSFSDGVPLGPYIALANDFADIWVLPAVTIAPAITLLPVVRDAETGTFTELETYRIGDRIGTMRRRTVRVGE